MAAQRGLFDPDDRPVPSGIVHALRCGGRRADCAAIHGSKKTLFNRFVNYKERIKKNETIKITSWFTITIVNNVNEFFLY